MKNIVTIIGSSYFQPIADLLSKLFSNENLAINEVQSSPFENGYSASICLLIVAMFESYSMRVRYFHSGNAASKERNPIIFLRKVYPNFSKVDELEEVYTVRDLIIHNHLWEIEIDHDQNWG